MSTLLHKKFSACRFASPRKHASVIPDSWIRKDGCLYPTLLSTEGAKMAVKRCLMPMSDWSFIKADVLASKIDYESACRKCRKDNDILMQNITPTDLKHLETTDVDAGGRGKRKKKRPNKLVDQICYEDSSDELEESVLRPFPKFPRMISSERNNKPEREADRTRDKRSKSADHPEREADRNRDKRSKSTDKSEREADRNRDKRSKSTDKCEREADRNRDKRIKSTDKSEREDDSKRNKRSKSTDKSEREADRNRDKRSKSTDKSEREADRKRHKRSKSTDKSKREADRKRHKRSKSTDKSKREADRKRHKRSKSTDKSEREDDSKRNKRSKSTDKSEREADRNRDKRSKSTDKSEREADRKRHKRSKSTDKSEREADRNRDKRSKSTDKPEREADRKHDNRSKSKKGGDGKPRHEKISRNTDKTERENERRIRDKRSISTDKEVRERECRRDHRSKSNERQSDFGSIGTGELELMKNLVLMESPVKKQTNNPCNTTAAASYSHVRNLFGKPFEGEIEVKRSTFKLTPKKFEAAKTDANIMTSSQRELLVKKYFKKSASSMDDKEFKETTVFGLALLLANTETYNSKSLTAANEDVGKSTISSNISSCLPLKNMKALKKFDKNLESPDFYLCAEKYILDSTSKKCHKNSTVGEATPTLTSCQNQKWKGKEAEINVAAVNWFRRSSGRKDNVINTTDDSESLHSASSHSSSKGSPSTGSPTSSHSPYSNTS